MNTTRLKNLIICLELWEDKDIRVACYNCPIYIKRRYLKKCTNISLRIKEDIEYYCSKSDLSFLTTQRFKTAYSMLYYKLCM